MCRKSKVENAAAVTVKTPGSRRPPHDSPRRRNRAGGIPRWPADTLDLLCTQCEFALSPILHEFYSGTPIEDIAEQAIEACVVLDLYDEEVCRGSVNLAIVSRALRPPAR